MYMLLCTQHNLAEGQISRLFGAKKLANADILLLRLNFLEL